MVLPQALQFSPPPGLRSPHLQTLLNSSFLRRRKLRHLLPTFATQAQSLVIPCRDQIRLSAKLNLQPQPAPLAIIIHGWLGEADSTYVLAMAQTLHAAGMSTARLNLRDHGGSEHLNVEMFNSARLAEVIDACNFLQQSHGRAGTNLLGYSLGGNFALRVAASGQVPLQSCFAVCPVVHPAATMVQLDYGFRPYRWYFLRKWRKAILAKQRAFPAHYDFGKVLGSPTLSALTDYFVARHTDFDSTPAYLDAYAITGDRLATLAIPTLVLTAADDPVIPVTHFAELAQPPALRVQITERGGHCGYLQNFALDTYADRLALAFLQRQGIISPHER